MHFRFLALPALLLATTIAFSDPPNLRLPIPSGPKNEVLSGQIYVKYRPSIAASIARASRNLVVEQTAGVPGARFRSRVGNSGWTVWLVPDNEDPRVYVERFRKQPGVFYAQVANRIYPLLTTPNDPDWNVDETDESLYLDPLGNGIEPFKRMWHLDETDAKLAFANWPNQWYTAANKPRNAPTIAVIDTGLDLNHPDFANAGNASTNVTNGGQIDHARSKQFEFGEIVPTGTVNEAHGHGSHVAGIALASGNNGGFSGHGIVGSGYNSQGMILRVFDQEGIGSDADAAAAIYYAADNGADIINLSLGTTNFSQILQEACTYAWQKGLLIVAAGNESGSGGGDLGPIYPAACSGVLAVTANGPDYVHATSTYAGTGRYIDIAAPGGDVVTFIDSDFGLASYKIQFVWSTAMRSSGSLNQNPILFPPYKLNYSYLAGTSMACPLVAGAAGLYYGKFNLRANTGYANVRAYRMIERTALDTNGAPGQVWEYSQGYGSLDMDALIRETPTKNPRGGTVEGIVYYNGTAVANVAVRARPVNGGTIITTTTVADGTYRFDVLRPGLYDITARPFGVAKTKRAMVRAGSDYSGHDFWCGNFNPDETPPTIGFANIVSSNSTSVTFDHWGYDPESTIDNVNVSIGTAPGAENILPRTIVVTDDSPRVVLTGLTLPTDRRLFLKLNYTNGAGMLTSRVLAFGPAAVYNGEFVDQSIADVMVAGQVYPAQIRLRNTGNTGWAPDLQILASQNATNNVTWGMNRVQLPGFVFPGDVGAINWNVTAPTTAGLYNFQWQLLNLATSPASWIGPMTTNRSIRVVSKANDASWVSFTNLPTSVRRGARFSVTVTMRNIGANVWTQASGFQLGSQNPIDNRRWGVSRVNLASGDSIAYNGTKSFVVECIAPSATGTYPFQWQMVRTPNTWFGQITPARSISVTP
jgi:serine protease